MRAVNLIPSDQRSGAPVGAGRSGGGAYAVVALLGGIALLALLYGMARHQVLSRRNQAATLSVQAQQAQAAASRLAPYTTFIALRESREQAVSQLVNSRFDWAHAFHELGRVLPLQVSITSLNGTIGSSAATTATAPSAPAAATSTAAAASSSVASATPAGSVPTFTLDGCASSQPAVAEMLERLRLIDGVSEVTLQSSTKGTTSGSGAASSGGCPGRAAAFAVQVDFDALPSVPTTGPSSKTVAATTAAPESKSTGSAPVAR